MAARPSARLWMGMDGVMLRLLRELTYKGSVIQIYERPCRRREGMECILLIDWMDVTSHSMIAEGPAECERRARQLIDEFCAGRNEPILRNRTPQHA